MCPFRFFTEMVLAVAISNRGSFVPARFTRSLISPTSDLDSMQR